MSKRKEFLLLKWGTLKDWSGVTNPKALKLIEKYFELGSSMSAAMQHDSLEQKEIICQIIDTLQDGQIHSDWSGEEFTKKQAKEYVMNYGKEK